MEALIMKFIIADDEPIVREGLKTIIDWSELGFTLCDEASDGNEAVEKILEKNPELVILDIKMPELSGVKVAEIVRQKGYRGKIIILSGFSDFAYAQAAIRQGVESYLVKPIDEEELIDALLKIRKKIEQENLSNIYHSKKLHNTKDMLLKHLLTDPVSDTVNNMNDYGLTFYESPYQLVMFDYSHYKNTDIKASCDYWQKVYSDNQAEFLIIDNTIVLLIQGTASIWHLTTNIIPWLNKASQEGLLHPFVIISGNFSEVSSFPENYQRLKKISARRFFYYEDNKPIHTDTLTANETFVSAEKLNPIEFIESIYMAIMDKNTSLISMTAKKLYYVLQNRNFTVEQIYQILINCILQLKALLNETYIKEFTEFNEKELINQICSCCTLNEIILLLENRFILFCDYVKKSSEVKIIEKVLNYIDIHYNEDIKLEKIADLFGYNPAYLGRLLFCRIGTNFNLYIERKRLDKAKDMLVHTDIKIPEICNLIGYQNVEYFYRKFKKYTNLTPGNYRAHHCNKLKLSKTTVK
jgi:two-component system, response regulator YesN